MLKLAYIAILIL